NAYNNSPTNGASVTGLWLMQNHIARPVAAMGQANDWDLFKSITPVRENFSARWNGLVIPRYSETYTFSTVSDDGVRLWVNGQLLIDNWSAHGGTEDKGAIALQAGKPYTIKMEYFNGSGGGVARLSWASQSQAKEIIPANALRPSLNANETQTGLQAEYFRGTNFETPLTTRIDQTVDTDWPQGLPVDSKATAWQARLPQGADPARSAWDNSVFFVWNDTNGDAQIQPQETTFFKLTGPVDGVTVMPDLSFLVTNVSGQAMRYAPVRFTSTGLPLYDAAHGQVMATGSQHPTSSGGGQTLTSRDGWTVLTVAPKPFAPQSLGGAYKGETRWSYPSLWPGLHASHIAPLPDHPGELIGTTRLLGNTVTPRGSDAGEVWAVNGNKGTIYLFTTDGLFVATLFKDSRTASWAFPEAKKEMLLNDSSIGEENFWPSISQTRDSTIYLNVFNGCIVRLDGLEKVRRLANMPLEVTTPMLQQAQAFFVQSEAQRQTVKENGPLVVALRGTAPTVDGKLDDWAGAKWVTIDSRQQQEGDWGRREVKTEAALSIAGDRLYAAFKTDDPNLLNNSGDALQNLFKTGGALDLMLGTDANADPKRNHAVAGDVRLLVTRVKGKTTAVLYRPVAPGTATEPITFASPIRTLKFDRVDDVSPQVQLAGGPEKTLEFSIPLATLGLQPKPEMNIRGDIGILRGNGFQTMQRVYWNNKASGIVSDVPSEAELTPQLWGNWQFKEE
ncbi:MAG: hypothetical protein JOZ57_01945, partial [Abitibacteriaceae bacterium]|nr:hypothetical protein [Abditibacteriaceae bacterium]